jgi:orotate phosphoribosyltransferase
MHYPDKAARIAAGSHGAFKAAAYRKSGAILFVESSLRQAREIVEITGLDVFCIESREMISRNASRTV